MPQETIVGTYRFRHEAEFALAVLAGRGVSARVVADDCGGVQPAFAATNGVRLLVDSTDAQEAEAILSADTPD